MPKVKICGITNHEDALIAADAGADYLGFIFYEKSPRYVQPDIATSIIAKLPSSIVPVGVFVNESRNFIMEIIEHTGIGMLQLSGDERPDDCLGYPVDVIKAFRMANPEMAKDVSHYDVFATLLDGASGNQYGGSGKLPSFSVAQSMKRYHRLFVAGGLNPDNITDVILNVEPFAVDVNSGVESAPGKKDPAKIQLLFERMRHLTHSTL